MIGIWLVINGDPVTVFGEEKFPSYEMILVFEMGMCILKHVPDGCMVCDNSNLAVIEIMLKFTKDLNKACGFQFGGDIIFLC